MNKGYIGEWEIDILQNIDNIIITESVKLIVEENILYER